MATSDYLMDEYANALRERSSEELREGNVRDGQKILRLDDGETLTRFLLEETIRFRCELLLERSGLYRSSSF